LGESKHKDDTSGLALSRKKVAIKNMVYNVEYSNVFSIFKYNGQQYVYVFGVFFPFFDVDIDFNYPYVNVDQSQKKHN